MIKKLVTDFMIFLGIILYSLDYFLWSSVKHFIFQLLWFEPYHIKGRATARWDEPVYEWKHKYKEEVEISGAH
jgi:hypothetical protein